MGKSGAFIKKSFSRHIPGHRHGGLHRRRVAGGLVRAPPGAAAAGPAPDGRLLALHGDGAQPLVVLRVSGGGGDPGRSRHSAGQRLHIGDQHPGHER